MIKNSSPLILLIFTSFTIELVNSWCLKTQFADSQKIRSIDFSPDGAKILTASESKRVIVWDAKTLEQLFVYNFPTQAYTARFSKDNSMIAVGGNQDSIHILRASDYTPITTSLATGQVVVYDIDFNEAMTNMISCGFRNYTNLYQIQAGPTFTPRGNSGDKHQSILACKFLKNSNYVAYSDKEGDAYTSSYTLTSLGSSNLFRSLFFDT